MNICEIIVKEQKKRGERKRAATGREKKTESVKNQKLDVWLIYVLLGFAIMFVQLFGCERKRGSQSRVNNVILNTRNCCWCGTSETT